MRPNYKSEYILGEQGCDEIVIRKRKVNTVALHYLALYNNTYMNILAVVFNLN